jgi:hypothetical protein
VFCVDYCLHVLSKWICGRLQRGRFGGHSPWPPGSFPNITGHAWNVGINQIRHCWPNLRWVYDFILFEHFFNCNLPYFLSQVV